MDIILGNEMKLSEVYKANELWKDPYACDKDAKHDYLTGLYDHLFAHYRERPVNLLEIGVWQGGSLILWQKFFKMAQVFAVDVQDIRCDQSKVLQRTMFFLENAYSETFIASMADNFFDFIIEDGSHKLEDMITTLENYHSKLKNGGCVIIEDIYGMDQNTNVPDAQNIQKLQEIAIKSGYKRFLIYDNRELAADNYCFCAFK